MNTTTPARQTCRVCHRTCVPAVTIEYPPREQVHPGGVYATPAAAQAATRPTRFHFCAAHRRRVADYVEAAATDGGSTVTDHAATEAGR